MAPPPSQYLSHREWENQLHGILAKTTSNINTLWHQVDTLPVPPPPPTNTEAVVIPLNTNSTPKRVRWEKDDAQHRSADSVEERELRSSVENMKVDLRSQKKDLAACSSMCHSHDMAMDVVKHELETRRSWFGRIEAERAENESWKSRIEGELSSLRVQREEFRRERDDLAAQVRGLQKQLYGTTADGGVVAQAQLQAHAAVAAAMAPLQAHLERELASVRRHVAALRANASYNSLEESDVSEALAVPRPSELVIKGIVSATVADAEEKVEARVNETLQVRLATCLASASEKIQKDTEEAVFARVRAAATREGARRGLLALVGGVGNNDAVFSATTADEEERFRRETLTAIQQTREQQLKLEDLSRGLDAIRTETALLGQQTKGSVVSLDASVSAKFAEVRQATASLRELVEMTDVASRRRFEKDRSETEARLSQSLEDVRKDVNDTARRHATLAASLDGLDERMRVVRETAAQVAEEAPGVRRAAQAASRIDAVEDQLTRIETRVGPESEARFTEASSLHEDLRRRIAAVEDKQGRFPLRDESARRDIQEAERRVAALEAQIAPLRDQVTHIPRIQRAEVDVENVRKRVEEASRDAAARLETHRRTMESAADLRDRRLDQLAARLAKTEDVAGTVSLSQTRIASLETDAADMREKFQRAHSELAEKSSDAFRASTAELKRALANCDSQLESCKVLAQNASHKADTCANDLHHLTLKLVQGAPTTTQPHPVATASTLELPQTSANVAVEESSPPATSTPSLPQEELCGIVDDRSDEASEIAFEETPRVEERSDSKSERQQTMVTQSELQHSSDEADDDSEEENDDIEVVQMTDGALGAEDTPPPPHPEESEEEEEDDVDIDEVEATRTASEANAAPQLTQPEEEEQSKGSSVRSTPFVSKSMETAVLGSLERLPSEEIGSDAGGSWDDDDDFSEESENGRAKNETWENTQGEEDAEKPLREDETENSEESQAIEEDEESHSSNENETGVGETKDVLEDIEKDSRRRQANDYSDDDDEDVDEIPEIPTLDDAGEIAAQEQGEDTDATFPKEEEDDTRPPPSPRLRARVEDDEEHDDAESQEMSSEEDEEEDSDVEFPASSYKSSGRLVGRERAESGASSALRTRLRNRGLAA